MTCAAVAFRTAYARAAKLHSVGSSARLDGGCAVGHPKTDKLHGDYTGSVGSGALLGGGWGSAPLLAVFLRAGLFCFTFLVEGTIAMSWEFVGGGTAFTSATFTFLFDSFSWILTDLQIQKLFTALFPALLATNIDPTLIIGARPLDRRTGEPL